MMTKKSYDELLKDPMWINKRKRIIYRDGGKCTVCGSKENLQVHHTYYYNQPVEPWRYPDEDLVTLCKGCHQDYHEHHETEYRDKPKTIKKKKFKPKRKLKVKKHKKRFKHKENLCLAKIQANRSQYKRDEHGTWKHI